MMSSKSNSTDFPDMVCYSNTIGRMPKSVWYGVNPLNYSIPLFLTQLLVINAVSRGLNSILHRFHQPRLVIEAIAGVVLGPTVLGMIPNYMDVLFPARSLPVLEAFGNLGLVSYIFLLGLQIDPDTLLWAGKQAWVMATACSAAPIIVVLLAFVGSFSNINHGDAFLVLVAGSLCITCYPVMSRVLAELKLIHTDTGRLAVLVAIIKTSVAWALLCVATSIVSKRDTVIASFEIIFTTIVFVTVWYFAVRRTMQWMASRVSQGEPIKEYQTVLLVAFVIMSYFVADAIGVHGVGGAFVVGLVLPKEPHVASVNDQWEDLVLAFFLPLFFACVGLKVDVRSLNNSGVYAFVITVVAISTLAKITVLTLLAVYYSMSLREGFCFAILMNIKGMMDIVILHIALERKLIFTQTYSIMVLLSIAITAAATPLGLLVHRPSRPVPYKRRTIENGRHESELRIVACIHSTRNVPSIISLIEFAYPTRLTPIHAYSIHLVELTGRESAMFIYHDNTTNHFTSPNPTKAFANANGYGGQSNYSRIKAQSLQIVKALENYERQAGGVSVQQLTVVSPYSTMHEDVCNLVEDKHVAFVIVPFHKQHSVDGSMDMTNPGIQTLNLNILSNSPCSVGILVDRGLNNASRFASGQHVVHHLALLFIGGPDDREALAYASRAIDHPCVSLTVIRFVDKNQPPIHTLYTGGESVIRNKERERLLDEECVKEMRVRTANNNTMVYVERRVGNGEEMVATIKAMENIYDLYVVGKGEGSVSPLMEGITEWTDCRELGPVGDLLASPDSTLTASVLVVQRYVGVELMEEEPLPRGFGCVRT